MDVSEMATQNWEDLWCVCVLCARVRARVHMHMYVHVTWEIGTQNLMVTRSNNQS